MNYWLFKSEPDTFSFDQLKASKNRTEAWDGVRNYQARNFMRDEVHCGDLVLFYHSSCAQPGVVGLAEVVREAYPDHTSWDKQSDYYDPKSSQENPRWFMVDIKWKKQFPHFVSLAEIKDTKALQNMKLVQRGQRLSIQPVTKKEFELICSLGGL
tara:strand:- start:67255 stop:67719 length:465 start_codon:yes stop_codon:yes gene_type:complete